MEPSNSSTSDHDEETKALESLLDCFNSVCSPEEIANAYYKAQGDVIKAGDILYRLQDRKQQNGVSHTETGWESYSQPKETVYEDRVGRLAHQAINCTKPKKLSASFGTVSCAVGKTYSRSFAPMNDLNEKTKPPKLEIEEPLVDEIDDKSMSKFAPRNGTFTNEDIQDFLFSMLGDGFKLSKDVIQEVLGNCGYDVKKMETSCSEESYPNYPSIIRMEEKNGNLPSEMLQSLFSFPERPEDGSKPKLPKLGLLFGQTAVREPLDDSTSTLPRDTLKTKLTKDLNEVDNYQMFRRAAKQHWDAMKEYYEAAIDAFAKGDKERASYLLEQGRHHNEMAREADEKSANEIVEPRKNKKEEIYLDLTDHEAKEALHIVKINIRSLANIPPFRCLKLNLGPDTEDSKKRRRRRKIIKLLEEESITWSDDKDNPGTICVQLDEIDPNNLSFVTEV